MLPGHLLMYFEFKIAFHQTQGKNTEMQPINLKNLLSTACLIGLMNLLVPGVLLGAQSEGPIGKGFDLVRYVECLPTNVNAAFRASGSGNELKWPDAFTTMVYSLAVPDSSIRRL